MNQSQRFFSRVDIFIQLIDFEDFRKYEWMYYYIGSLVNINR
jgi:hypothetical protein